MRNIFAVQISVCFLALVSVGVASAADLNGYEARYEVKIATPTPTGLVSCSGSSGPNPNAAGEYIIRDNSGWNQINSGSYRKFFVCPGDYTAKGRIDLTASGSRGNERFIVWWTSNSYSAQIHPVKMADSAKAKLREIWFRGADYVVIDRLVMVPNGGSAIRYEAGANSNNNLVNRILVEAGRVGGANGGHAYFVLSSNHYNTLQNSVIRNCRAVFRADTLAININEYASHNRVVNNEVYNCTHAFQIGGRTVGTSVGTIVENNDFYLARDRLVNQCDKSYWEARYQVGQTIPLSDPAFSTSGPCMCSESSVSFKFGSADPSRPLLFVHNRIWGTRPDNNNGCGGSGGSAGNLISLSNSANYLVMERNIIHDSQNGMTFSNNKYGTPGNNEIRSNVIGNIKTYFSGRPTRAISDGFGSRNRYSFNTIAHVTGGQWIYTNSAPHEVSCNLLVNAGDARVGANTVVRNNVYVGSSRDAGESSRSSYGYAASSTESFCFYRKLITGAEKVCMDGVIPTTSSPFAGGCGSYLPSSSYGFVN